MNSSFLNLQFRKLRPSFYGLSIKRVLDVCIALPAVLVLSPFLLLIALVLVLVQGGNPFFVQKRIGRFCKPFYIIKFRTMTEECDAEGEMLPDEQRTTWLGSVMRMCSLDELPEIINVLKGDMSFIGPRPWVPEQMATFRPTTQQHRMAVRPGLSGLAQILGRNGLTFRQRVCYDLLYIRNLSFGLDAKIFFYTLYKVVLREGISQRPNALGKAVRINTPKDHGTEGQRGNQPRGTHKG